MPTAEAQRKAARDFHYQNAQRGPMRAFDGIRVTLAIGDGAKNHAVEVIESHRFLAAPVRRSKENQNIMLAPHFGEGWGGAALTGAPGVAPVTALPYPSFPRPRTQVKRTNRPAKPAKIARISPRPPLRHNLRPAGSPPIGKNQRIPGSGRLPQKPTVGAVSSYYNEDGDFIEVRLSDESYYAERADGLVTMFVGRESGQVVGAVVKGIRKLLQSILEAAPGFRVEIMDDDGFRVEHLFSVALWKRRPSPYDEPTVKQYKYLRDAAEENKLTVDLKSTLEAVS